MGWLRSVGSFKLYVSFAEYCLFYTHSHDTHSYDMTSDMTCHSYKCIMAHAYLSHVARLRNATHFFCSNSTHFFCSTATHFSLMFWASLFPVLMRLTFSYSTWDCTCGYTYSCHTYERVKARADQIKLYVSFAEYCLFYTHSHDTRSYDMTSDMTCHSYKCVTASAYLRVPKRDASDTRRSEACYTSVKCDSLFPAVMRLTFFCSNATHFFLQYLGWHLMIREFMSDIWMNHGTGQSEILYTYD